MKKKNILEMIKSFVSNHHIYHIKIFCSTPKWRWYGNEHRGNKLKSQNKFKNKNKVKKHTIKNHTNIRNTFQKIIHKYVAWARTFTVWLVISNNSKYASWYNQTKSMTNIKSYSQGTFWWCRILWTWVYVS